MLIIRFGDTIAKTQERCSRLEFRVSNVTEGDESVTARRPCLLDSLFLSNHSKQKEHSPQDPTDKKEDESVLSNSTQKAV